jgi:Zn-dependent protease with chaperone function
MNALYGTSKAGVDVMNILKEKNRFDIEFLSSHPNLDNRIKYINKFSR